MSFFLSFRLDRYPLLLGSWFTFSVLWPSKSVVMCVCLLRASFRVPGRHLVETSRSFGLRFSFLLTVSIWYLFGPRLAFCLLSCGFFMLSFALLSLSVWFPCDSRSRLHFIYRTTPPGSTSSPQRSLPGRMFCAISTMTARTWFLDPHQ